MPQMRRARKRKWWDGVTRPKEVLYSERMTERLMAYAPNASELVRIAARAQHIRRWTIPRSDYPMDRKGYYQWRINLGRFHADETTKMMKACGYEEREVDATAALLRKEDIKGNPEMQLLEDVICLVFMEHYLEAFAEDYDDDRLGRIIRRTWGKMSTDGQQAALQLPLPESLYEPGIQSAGSIMTEPRITPDPIWHPYTRHSAAAFRHASPHRFCRRPLSHGP